MSSEFHIIIIVVQTWSSMTWSSSSNETKIHILFSTAGWLSFPAPSPYELDAIKRVEAKEEKKIKLTKSISRTQFTVFIFFHFARSFIATLRIHNLFLFCNAAGLWSRKKEAATSGAHEKVKGKVSGWAKQREWKKKLNRKAPAVWREKLLANVFEDYLFSFLFSHFTISHFYLFDSSHTPRQPCAICMHVTSTPRGPGTKFEFEWDLFANEVTDKAM